MAAAVAGHEDLALRLLHTAGPSAAYLARYRSGSLRDCVCHSQPGWYKDYSSIDSYQAGFVSCWLHAA